MEILSLKILWKKHSPLKKNNGRDILYSLYTVNTEQYISAQKLNQIRASLDDNCKPEILEKIKFAWVDARALIQHIQTGYGGEKIEINDIEGEKHSIELRKYFVEDCLKNEDFQKIFNVLNKQAVQK